MKTRVVRPGHFQQERKTIKIHVSQLKIGMYICSLDKDWLETPFLMQGFAIESMDDIKTVEQHCEHVWIDEKQENWVAAEERAISKNSERKKVNYNNTVSAEDEHQNAIGVYKESRRITKTLLDEVRLSGALDTEAAKNTVHECVQSILRNPDALIWMSKMREQDEYTSEHCLNVCILAIAFGRQLGLSEEELYTIGLCGLLHDVGKMKIPPEVLNKAGELTPKEQKMMQAHSTHGRNLLLSSPGTNHSVVDVAYSHHERIDGNGYPRGLKSAGITPFAKMIAIVDAYDAMTAHRCYAPAIPSTDALKIIFNDRNTHFDEHLANAFIKTVGLYPPGSIVELKSGEVGFVLTTNHRYNQLPKIIVVLDANKKACKERVINLTQVEQGRIGRENLIKKVHVDGSFNLFVRDYREQGLIFSHG